MKLQASDLHALFSVLHEEGYTVVGPTVQDGAIVYDQLESPRDLPQGWTDTQEAGHYRISQTDTPTYFNYNMGPQSFKRFLDPPRRQLWTATRQDAGFEIETCEDDAPAYAMIGVRACEIAAIHIQDRVFGGGPFHDGTYMDRRDKALIIAVNCGKASSTCFCVSTDSGPRVEAGYDLVMTEILEPDAHVFIIEAGSTRGSAILERLPLQEDQAGDGDKVDALMAQTRDQMGRSLDLEDIKDLLYRNDEHPHWEQVAARCLSCANCTLVCPTCFCSTVEDTTDLTGDHAQRWKRWDSCFTLDHSYLHGGSVRASTRSRYRQWLTHKLAGWIDQFGTTGCVGCGRCIAWCPVGIDITQEAASIRAQDAATAV